MVNFLLIANINLLNRFLRRYETKASACHFVVHVWHRSDQIEASLFCSAGCITTTVPAECNKTNTRSRALTNWWSSKDFRSTPLGSRVSHCVTWWLLLLMVLFHQKQLTVPFVRTPGCCCWLSSTVCTQRRSWIIFLKMNEQFLVLWSVSSPKWERCTQLV